MPVSDLTYAALLLTARFGRPSEEDAPPLTPVEWSRLCARLAERGLPPETLVLEADPSSLLEELADRAGTADRMSALLARGALAGLAVEKWERAGLWILARGEAEYPRRLADRLGESAPPVLFGCGRTGLLGLGGIAVVGSRDASAEDLEFALDMGRRIALDGRSVISGGARGIDETAVLGALEAEGTAVVALPDNLLRAALSARYREPLMSRNLALLSAVSPEAGFDVTSAMGRNRLIYCLSDGAVIAASAAGSGGTWHGAMENRKWGWTPWWVRPSAEPSPGIRALMEAGARVLPDPIPEIGELLASAVEEVEAEELRAYEAFLEALDRETADSALTPTTLQRRLGEPRKRISQWLDRALTEGRAEETAGRYRTTAAARLQGSLPL